MNYRQEYEKWLASPALSEEERAELKAIANDEREIENRFYGPLEFGTAGLRGTMYVGLHNMNRHVIRWATQGFANVIRAEGEAAMQKGVAICMDCRNHSTEFAREAACVMAGNGIAVRLFESLRPTPELSFAVREYGCEAGINVTASATRSTGRTARSCRPSTPPPSQENSRRSTFSRALRPWTLTRRCKRVSSRCSAQTATSASWPTS